MPHYKFDLQLPEIPVKAKLFTLKLDHKKATEYELSQVEVNQEQILNVDYDMGLGLDLIDRGIYSLDPEMPPGKLQTAQEVQALKAKIEELRLSLLDDRDQFLVSESNTWVDPFRQAEKGEGAEGLLPTKLPAKHRLIHRKGNWGRNMKDQLAVRDISELEGYEEQIITTGDKGLKAKNREKAIQRIEKRFVTSKNLKVGAEKTPGSGIYATKVLEITPMMRMMTNSFVLTVCDDIIEEEL